MPELLPIKKEEHTDGHVEEQEGLRDIFTEARNALREFVAKEKSGELGSGHFLPGLMLKEGFNDADIPDEEIVIFLKARDRTLTDGEYKAYRSRLFDEKSFALKSVINPSRHALFQYVNNMMTLIEEYKEIEKHKLAE